MNLRAQLTLWSVLVMAVIVGTVTAVDLAQEVKLQFESALERADYTMQVAVNEVKQTVNRNPTIAISDALLTDKDLPNDLLAAMSTSKSLYEIAVCDPQGVILVDSVPTPAGTKFPTSLPDFGPLVHNGSLVEKMRVLLLAGSQKYQRSQGLGVPNQPIAIYVRVVVWPALMTQKEIIPIIQRHAEVSLLRLNSGISRAVQTQTTLEKQNMALQTSIAELTSGERVTTAAAGGQMIEPPAGQQRYLTARPASDPARAARRYKPPSERAKAIMANRGMLTKK